MSTYLQVALGPYFPAVVRRRGRRYFDEGRVQVARRAPTAVEAVVLGERPYEVEIHKGRRGWQGTCACPAFRDTGLCKHLWAVIAAYDAGANGDAWRLRLESLRELPDDPWAAVGRPDRRVLFALDVDGTIDSRWPVFSVLSQRHVAARGWAEPRPATAAQLRALPPADREIVAMFAREPWDDFDYRYDSPRLPPALLESVLPRLCSTGRFFWMREGELGPGPLAFDAGPPWVFGLDIGPAEGGRDVAVQGFLVRGDERVPVTEPVLLLDSGLVFFERAVARLDPRGSMAAIVDLRARGPLVVPRAEKAALLEFVAAFPGRPLLRGDVAPAVAAPAPVPVLCVAAAAGRSSVPCEIAFDYDGRRVAAEEATGLVRDGETFLRRDAEAERRALRRFLEAGGRCDDRRGSFVRVKALPGLVRTLVDEEWTVEAEGRRLRRAGAFDLSVRSGIDWFELEGGLDFEGEVAPLPALVEAARRGARTVRLADGSEGMLPETWLERWRALDAAGRMSGDSFRFGRNQGWMLDLLLADRPEVATDEAFEEVRARARAFETIRPGREPEGFRGELRGYQRDALGWFAFLRELGLGGCLADDMGLGKTVQVLALLEERRGCGAPSLVVAPKSLVFNWVAEAERFTPGLRVAGYVGPDRRKRIPDPGAYDLVVTTYGTLRRDAVDLGELEFDYAILDEAQAIKNPRSQAAKAARLLRARHRLALTGTPVENHLGDLWSLFEFLNPGMLGRLDAFQTLARAASDEEERARLGRALRPFVLRRTKEQVLADLPDKTEQVLYCDLRGAQRKDYDGLRAHYRSALLAKATNGSLAKVRMHVLEALLRLRQAACHPGLLDRGRCDEPSAKLDRLLPLLEEVIEEGHKALVFSQFTSFLAIVRRELDRRGIGYEYLDGRTRKREEKVRRFQAAPVEECPLFLVSLKAGGFGLNLTAADYVFLLDPWWNPAVERQAIDRTHRIGQTRKVMAYRIIGRGTVEERILELQAGKRALADAIAGADGATLRDLTREDLERILS